MPLPPTSRPTSLREATRPSWMPTELPTTGRSTPVSQHASRHVYLHVHWVDIPKQPCCIEWFVQYEACMCECCPVGVLQLHVICWKLLSKRHVHVHVVIQNRLLQHECLIRASWLSNFQQMYTVCTVQIRYKSTHTHTRIYMYMCLLTQHCTPPSRSPSCLL